MTLDLDLAPVASKPDPAVELRGVYVEEWIDALPYANPVALLRTYADTLARFNRSPVKPALRLQLLELYLRPYLYLLDLQEKQGPVHSIAVFERQRADTEAARRVAVELALGYKRVLSETAGKRSLFGGAKEPRVALQRATLFLSHALLHSFDEYLPAPPELWRELHALHLYAGELELLDATAPPVGDRNEFSDPVDALYKRVLLTSLVDPYRLPYGDVWVVYGLFGAHAALATIGPPAPVERPAGVFLLDPERDFRAVPLPRDSRPGEPARMLDAVAVRAPLEKRFAELQDGGVLTVRSGTTASLLGTMIRALGLPPKRHSPRERTEGRVNLATGLVGLHHFLDGGSTPATQPAPPADDGEIDLVGEPTAMPGEPAARREYTAEFWELVDHGPGGIGVIKRIRPNNAIGVGELLGVQFPMRGNGPESWTVGVVRWLSIAKAGEYQAGVQILAQSAEPVEIEPQGGDPAATPLRALAIPSLDAVKGASLVAPNGSFEAAKSFEVVASGRRATLRPETLIESTGAYDRFSFSLGG